MLKTNLIRLANKNGSTTVSTSTAQKIVGIEVSLLYEVSLRIQLKYGKNTDQSQLELVR